MEKILMSVPLSIEIQGDANKKKKNEIIKVEVRELTKTEKKENKELSDKYLGLAKSLNKLQSKHDSLVKRRDYSEKLENFKEAFDYQEKLDVLAEELGETVKEIESLGGDDFTETKAKENFELLVSGDGKERLAEIAEIKGYEFVTKLLYTAREKAEGK